MKAHRRALTGQRPEPLGQVARSGGDKVEVGGVFRSEDRGKTWTKLNDLCPRPFYFGQIRVDPGDSQRVYVLGTTFYVSQDGGKTFATASGGHADNHALWINPGYQAARQDLEALSAFLDGSDESERAA